jgi:hypothetical protein
MISPAGWATALATGTGLFVAAKDIRTVNCVGLDTSYVLCGWQERFGATRQPRSRYADVSQKDGRAVRLIG